MAQALEAGVDAALQTSDNKIDGALLRSLMAQGLDARPRAQISTNRKFEDDIRVCAGDDDISIEVENYGNRLEFDLLKMMSFAETVPPGHRAFGCLIIPADKRLPNPFISGNGNERIWDYVTKRLLPMIVPVAGLRLENILVLGYERPQHSGIPNSVVRSGKKEDQSLRGAIQKQWTSAGKPAWGVDETMKIAIAADMRLEREGFGDPAAEFRANRKANQVVYLRRWVRGCKFEWLQKS